MGEQTIGAVPSLHKLQGISVWTHPLTTLQESAVQPSLSLQLMVVNMHPVAVLQESVVQLE
jgi:hypothetical protein